MLTEARHTRLFTWDPAEFWALLRSCDRDDGVQLALRYLPSRGRILEAGAGSGRVVRYLHDRGYEITGYELSREAVEQVNESQPDLDVRVGDISALPVPDGYYAGLLSFGLVEHFIAGPEAALHEHFRVLAPGGLAIITVPSYNGLRRVKPPVSWLMRSLRPRQNNFLRRFFGRPPLERRRRDRLGATDFRYHVYQQGGEFFEYRFRPKEFEAVVVAAGFRILRSEPISHMDGLHIELGSRFVAFRDWRFYPTPAAIAMDRVLRHVRFFHNHMHAIVATK